MSLSSIKCIKCIKCVTGYLVDFFNLLWIINLPLIVFIVIDNRDNKNVLTFFHVCFISMSSFLHMISYLFFKTLDKNTSYEEKNMFLSLLNFVHLLLLLYFIIIVKTYSIIYTLTISYIVIPIVINFLEILKNRQSY